MKKIEQAKRDAQYQVKCTISVDWKDQDFQIKKAFPTQFYKYQYYKVPSVPYNKIIVRNICPNYVYQLLLIPQQLLLKLIVHYDSNAFAILLFWNNKWELVIIDMFIPIYKNNKDFLYSLPQVWICGQLILKAFAKLMGSYQKAQKCNPFTLLKCFTYPNYQIFNIQKQQISDIIRFLSNAIQANFKVYIKSKKHDKINELGLVSNVVGYEFIQGRFEQNMIVKLRTSMSNQWNGNYSIYDQKFKNIYNSIQNFSYSSQLFMRIQDFNKLFSLCFVRYWDPQIDTYQIQQYKFRTKCKNTKFFKFHSSNLQKCSFIVSTFNSYIRIKIILAKIQEQFRYQYMNSSMTINQNTLSLQHFLQNGEYILGIRIGQKMQQKQFSLLILGQKQKIFVKEIEFNKNQKYSFYHSLFKTHGLVYGQISLLDQDKCWSTSVDLLKQMGYCYMIFYIDKDAKYKFIIKINRQNLKKQGFKLKYPYKNKQKISILVQEAKVIVFKPLYQKMDFPPKSIQYFRAQISQRNIQYNN